MKEQKVAYLLPIDNITSASTCFQTAVFCFLYAFNYSSCSFRRVGLASFPPRGCPVSPEAFILFSSPLAISALTGSSLLSDSVTSHSLMMLSLYLRKVFQGLGLYLCRSFEARSASSSDPQSLCHHCGAGRSIIALLHGCQVPLELDQRQREV